MTTPELIAAIKKYPLSVGCGVISLALIAGIYLRSDAIPEASALYDTKAAEARRYALNLANAAQLKEQLDAMVAANKAIDARLIRPSDIGINQQYFYKLESDSGVKLTDLRQGARSTAKNGYLPVTFTVAAQGDFAQIMKFLRGIEDGTRYCRVLTGQCIGNRTGPVTLSLTLEILGRP